MMVTNKEYFGALAQLSLQKTLHIGNYAARLRSTIERIAFFQETPEHIYD